MKLISFFKISDYFIIKIKCIDKDRRKKLNDSKTHTPDFAD